METHFFKVDWQNRRLYKRLFGPYIFSACPCGCTKYPGFGFAFLVFGVNFQFHTPTNKACS